MTLQEVLDEVREVHGKLTAPIVVAAATPETHPLHNRFEWDDRIAGPKYREVQAREIIRSVKIVRKETEKGEAINVRAYVAYDDGDGHREYVPTEEVVMNDIQLAIVLRDMKRRWTDLRVAYGHMVEFADMVRRDLETG